MTAGELMALDELIRGMGEAGLRMAQIEAAEGAAGNISVCTGWGLDPGERFPLVESISLPVTAPALAALVGYTLVVTGSGRRMREIASDPAGNLGCVVVDPGGETGRLYTAEGRKFTRLTSELNTHLAVHGERVERTGTKFTALVHAQPPHLTYLSQIPRYREETYFNRRVLRWEPELILQMPEGIGVARFCVPGSEEMVAENLAALREHPVVVWSKHGVMARSDGSIEHACDLIEYAEAGARYECMNLSNGEQGEGLTAEEIRAICEAYGVRQGWF